MGGQVGTANAIQCMSAPIENCSGSACSARQQFPGEEFDSPLPAFCDSAANEILFDLNCIDARHLQDFNLDEEVAPVQSKWMKKPVIEAFAARLAALEEERLATIEVEDRLEALEQEKRAAVEREDFKAAQQFKQEIEGLKQKVNVVNDARSLPQNTTSFKGHQSQHQGQQPQRPQDRLVERDSSHGLADLRVMSIMNGPSTGLSKPNAANFTRKTPPSFAGSPFRKA